MENRVCRQLCQFELDTTITCFKINILTEKYQQFLNITCDPHVECSFKFQIVTINFNQKCFKLALLK